MTPIAHISGAYLAIKSVDKLRSNLGLNEKSALITGVLTGLVIDIDVFFYSSLRYHHNSPLHTPLFWLVVVLLMYVVGIYRKNNKLKSLALSIFIGAYSHIFLDWISTRGAGMLLLYPFSNRIFSLFPLDPPKVNITLWESLTSDRFIKFYLLNPFLVVAEILVFIAGLLLFVKEEIIKRK